jgi:integrase
LLPIWNDKPETARRVLQRLHTVLDFANAAGYRSGDNPCRAATLGLPKQSAAPQHLAALPYKLVPTFIRQLRDSGAHTTVNLALELLVLSAARSGEIRGATFSEFDLTIGEWRIPAHRMKGYREHVVPLSERAIEIVRGRRPLSSENELVFPSSLKGGQLSDMAFTMVLRRMKLQATVHGFRSSFRDWCSEETNYPREVCEMALAHAIEDKVEAAYRRGFLVSKRRQLMLEWERYALAKP